MAVSHPSEYNFFPKSWILPEDNAKFQTACKQNKGKNKKKFYITKTVNSTGKNNE